MNNVMKIVNLGMCVGCCNCDCEHITFKENKNRIPIPVVDDTCTNCGKCLSQCIYDPDRDD